MRQETPLSRARGRSRSRVVALLWAVLLFAGSANAYDLEILELSGDMFVTGETLVDPPPHEPAATHAYFRVDGAVMAGLSLEPSVTATRWHSREP